MSSPPLAKHVIIGTRDVSMAGVLAILSCRPASASHSLVQNNLPGQQALQATTLVDQDQQPIVSLIAINAPLTSAEQMNGCAFELASLLVSATRVEIVGASTSPVLRATLFHAVGVNGYAYQDIRQTPLEAHSQLAEPLLSSLLNFLGASGVPTSLYMTRGYRATGRPDDGTDKVG